MKRPLLRYFGGKFRIADWVVSHFPPHRQYVEPFGGAASVLLHKSRSYNEIYNDKNGDIVNLFQVIRDPQLSKKLIENVRLTPYSRDEFDLSYEKTDDPVEKARRIIVRSHFAFSSSGVSRKYKTGFQNTSMRNNANEWADFPEPLIDIINRMIGVTVENTAAVDLIIKFDHKDTLFYIDPPYLPSTRVNGGYEYEMTEDDHIELLELISGLKGKVVISGYDSDLYNSSLLPLGYQKRTRSARGQRGGGWCKNHRRGFVDLAQRSGAWIILYGRNSMSLNPTKDQPNEINLLHIRIFDLEVALSEMIKQNTDLNEMLKKEMESNHIRIKKIAELMKELQTHHHCDNDIYKSMSNE